MTLHFNWFNLLVLFGALQAFIFSIVLLFQRKHPGAIFLSAFVFVIAYNGFETFNWSAGLDQHYMFFDLFGFIVIYAIGPSLYLYISKLLYPDTKFSRKEVFSHYGLVLFQFVTRIAIIVYHLLWINKIIDSEMPSMVLVNIVWSYAEPLSVCVFLVYFGASALKLRKYQKETVGKSQRKERQPVLSWARALMLCMTLFAIAWPLTVLAPDLIKVPFDMHYYPIEIALVLFTYWLVIYGHYRVKTISIKEAATVTALSSQTEAEKYLKLLQKAMEEEKLYLDPELTVNKLASHTGIASKTISAILNQYHQTSFNDFVNGYRIKEVQERLIDPANRHFTISSIALDSGFNSHATFQRVFKNSVGMSPKEYMNLHLRKTG